MNPDDLTNLPAAAEGLAGVWKWVAGLLLTGVSTLGGWFLWRTKSQNAAEDTVYAVTNATIRRQAAEIIELSAQKNALMGEISNLFKLRFDAEAKAAQAGIQADNAKASAERAIREANEANGIVAQMRLQREADREYISQLRAMLINAGLHPPEEPEL